MYLNLMIATESCTILFLFNNFNEIACVKLKIEIIGTGNFTFKYVFGVSILIIINRFFNHVNVYVLGQTFVV